MSRRNDTRDGNAGPVRIPALVWRRERWRTVNLRVGRGGATLHLTHPARQGAPARLLAEVEPLSRRNDTRDGNAACVRIPALLGRADPGNGSHHPKLVPRPEQAPLWPAEGGEGF
jgi:hypothetical protein